MAAKKGCLRYISSLISQKKKLTWNFEFHKLIVGYKLSPTNKNML